MGEKEVLSIIYEELDNMNINYYYMINDSSDVIYPYVTGEYYEYDYKLEDGSTAEKFSLKYGQEEQKKN